MGEQLIGAAWEGTLEEVRGLITNGVDVNFEDEDGHTSLYYAIKKKKAAVAALLYAAGAVPTEKDTGEMLVDAAKEGNSDEVRRLVQRGVDVNYEGWDGHAALFYAIKNKNDAVAEQLCAAGAELTEKEMGDQLVKAAYDGNVENASRLIAHGVDVNYVDVEGNNALTWASARGNTNIVYELVLSGADIHARGKGGQTAAQHARTNKHLAIAALLEAAMSPPLITGTPESVHLFAAGLPLQPYPQPAYHTLVHHEGLLLSVIGPWLRDAGLPQAATNPELKVLIFTLISHTYTVAITNCDVAEQFFKDYLVFAAQLKQDEMPAHLHSIATQMGVDIALAPAALRDTTDHKIEINQGDYLAFMKPNNLDVVEEVLAECNDKFVQMKKEAEAAIVDLADPKRNNIGQSWTYMNAKAHSLPTLPEVLVTALCLVSTFIFAHLQKTHEQLFAVIPVNLTTTTHTTAQSTCPTQECHGLIKWPAVKTMLRMLAKMRDDYAELDRPWTALLDTVRFSLVSKTLVQHAEFLQHFLPPGMDIAKCSSGKSAKKRRVVRDEQYRDATLTVVRAKSTLDDSEATVKQELWNLSYHPDGLTFEAMVGEGGLEETAGADRFEEYGDVKWKENPNNLITALNPRNPLFRAALTTAKQANPTISPYLWEPALKLLAHPDFASQPVAMVIEVQLYLEEFLQFRKAVHCYYKITRAPNLASLAQDCRKYAKNPEIAYGVQNQIDSDTVEDGKEGK